jgi:YesN/AraC family two-component response regulator
MKSNIKNCGIYEIRNTFNNKIYIGSSKNLYGRCKKHFSLLKHNKHTNMYLQNSYNKHGSNLFEFNVLEHCEEPELTILEQKYIDSTNSDYNITREVIRNTPSPESRIRHSQTKKKMYASGELTPTRMRDVYQYGLDGNLIKKWTCIKTACKHVGIVQSTIHRCLNGGYKTAGGYIWMYESDGDKTTPIDNYKRKSNSMVKLFKLTNIETGESVNLTMRDLEEKFNTSRNNISQYFRKDLILRKQYKIYRTNEKVKIDLLKSDELLETPEEDNQQPSL